MMFCYYIQAAAKMYAYNYSTIAQKVKIQNPRDYKMYNPQVFSDALISKAFGL